MTPACPLEAPHEMHLLIQADLDGALTPAEAARVAAHLERCPACAALQTRLLALSDRIRTTSPRHAAPPALRDALRTRIAMLASPEPAAMSRPRWRSPARFGAGMALAAMLLLVVGLPALLRPPPEMFTGTIVASHVRALQPGHLMDVASTDQHTVKPWFDGRLDFAPPVKDLAPDGFPLIGGRLDYLADRPVAALVYQRRQHVIDLFVWPAGATPPDPAPAARSHHGYNVRRWTRDRMEFAAVSDLDPQELAMFAGLWSKP